MTTRIKESASTASPKRNIAGIVENGVSFQLTIVDFLALSLAVVHFTLV